MELTPRVEDAIVEVMGVIVLLHQDELEVELKPVVGFTVSFPVATPVVKAKGRLVVGSLDGDCVVASVVTPGRLMGLSVVMLKETVEEEPRLSVSEVVSVFEVLEFLIVEVLEAVRVTLMGVDVGSCVLNEEVEFNNTLLRVKAEVGDAIVFDVPVMEFNLEDVADSVVPDELSASEAVALIPVEVSVGRGGRTDVDKLEYTEACVEFSSTEVTVELITDENASVGPDRLVIVTEPLPKTVENDVAVSWLEFVPVDTGRLSVTRVKVEDALDGLSVDKTKVVV